MPPAARTIGTTHTKTIIAWVLGAIGVVLVLCWFLRRLFRIKGLPSSGLYAMDIFYPGITADCCAFGGPSLSHVSIPLPSAPPPVHHPDRLGRPRQSITTRAADVDALGRRQGTFGDDVKELDDLPAYTVDRPPHYSAESEVTASTAAGGDPVTSEPLAGPKMDKTAEPATREKRSCVPRNRVAVGSRRHARWIGCPRGPGGMQIDAVAFTRSLFMETTWRRPEGLEVRSSGTGRGEASRGTTKQSPRAWSRDGVECCRVWTPLASRQWRERVPNAKNMVRGMIKMLLKGYRLIEFGRGATQRDNLQLVYGVKGSPGSAEQFELRRSRIGGVVVEKEAVECQRWQSQNKKSRFSDIRPGLQGPQHHGNSINQAQIGSPTMHQYDSNEKDKRTVAFQPIRVRGFPGERPVPQDNAGKWPEAIFPIPRPVHYKN
ncbi:hypothetical protein FB45DRAFT_870262 [Roridomyces roridus]|uniref:Uncharacterized protein n=1 Tax=Roridomyces roridus TaxID=1738132 RepID=A0AAD7BIN8_9AGAR|nr:hypothetical protein FB45DRAFT_870262 [Roridomyces roridus]